MTEFFYIDQIKLLINNKYILWYEKICRKAINRAKNKKEAIKLVGYVESHHILPKCFGMVGEKDKENLVNLTAREHFIAHKLLVFAFKGTKFWISCIRAVNAFKQSNKFQQRILSSRDYEFIRLCHFISINGSNNPNLGKKRSDEVRQKQSISAKKWIRKKEMCEKISKSKIGKPGAKWSIERRKEWSNTMKIRVYSKEERNTFSRVQKIRCDNNPQLMKDMNLKSVASRKNNRELFYKFKTTDIENNCKYYHTYNYFCEEMGYKYHTIWYLAKKYDNIRIPRGRFKNWIFSNVDVSLEE
jgi:hypothetical protein